MRPVLLTLCAALVLAGCSGGTKGDNSSSGAGAGAAGGQEAQDQPGNLSADTANMAIPVTPPSPTPIAAIPAAFQGRWGLVANDCDPGKSYVAKGLMTIAGSRLSFYESRGTATRIRRLGDKQIAFDLPMSGEGSSWSEPTTLTIESDGRTLVRQATGSPDRAGSFPYQRCPA